MPLIRNKAPGPRVFNLKVTQPGQVRQHTLQSGEVADLDLLVSLDDDPITAAWKKAGEVEEVSAADAKAEPLDMDAVLKAEAEATEAVRKAQEMRARVQALEVDAERRTPPRMQAADGGPQQAPTVDGQGGAKTPAQEEEGRPEPPRAEATAAAAEREAKATKAAEDEKKADARKARS